MSDCILKFYFIAAIKREKIDIAAIENTIVNFSHLVSEKWSGIKEIEINPLLVSANCLVALDARVILHETSQSMEVDGTSNTNVIRPAIRPYPTNYDQGWVSKKGKVILSKFKWN
jgi:acetyltransferase